MKSHLCHPAAANGLKIFAIVALLLGDTWSDFLCSASANQGTAPTASDEARRLADLMSRILPEDCSLVRIEENSVPKGWVSDEHAGILIESSCPDGPLLTWFLPHTWIGVAPGEFRETFRDTDVRFVWTDEYKVIALGRGGTPTHLNGLYGTIYLQSERFLWSGAIGAFSKAGTEAGRVVESLLTRHCATRLCKQQSIESVILAKVPAGELLVDCAKSRFHPLRRQCFQAAAYLRPEGMLRYSKDLIESEQVMDDLRFEAVESLLVMKDKEAGPWLVKALRKTNNVWRASQICSEIARIGYQAAVPDILALKAKVSRSDAVSIVGSLSRLGVSEQPVRFFKRPAEASASAESLKELIEGEDVADDVLIEAARDLVQLDGGKAGPWVAKVLDKTGEPTTVVKILGWLAEIQYYEAAPRVASLLAKDSLHLPVPKMLGFLAVSGSDAGRQTAERICSGLELTAENVRPLASVSDRPNRTWASTVEEACLYYLGPWGEEVDGVRFQLIPPARAVSGRPIELKIVVDNASDHSIPFPRPDLSTFIIDGKEVRRDLGPGPIDLFGPVEQKPNTKSTVSGELPVTFDKPGKHTVQFVGNATRVGHLVGEEVRKKTAPVVVNSNVVVLDVVAEPADNGP